MDSFSENSEFLYRYVNACMPQALRRFIGVSNIVQSVMLRIHRGQQQFRGQTDQQYRSWIRQIAHHRILDGVYTYRLDAGVAHGTIDHDRADLPDKGSSSIEPVDQVTIGEQAERIMEAIERLPDDIKQIVLLRYSYDLTFDQIASRMNLSTTTCRRRWLEGCETLKVRLQSIL